MVGKRRYFILRHQGKEGVICNALSKAGYICTNRLKQADFALTHMDANVWKKRFNNYKRPVFMYPHALDTWQNYDFGVVPWDKIVCSFIAGSRGKQILEFLKYPRPIELIGFPYLNEVLPLTVSTGNKILFAPYHSINGKIDIDKKNMNLNVLGSLATLYPAWDITIYLHHSLKASGIFGIPGFNYSFSDLTISNAVRMIKSHDYVIAEGTFLNLAVALGKPSISFNTKAPIHANGLMDLKIRHPELMNLWAYPIDLYEYDNIFKAFIDSQNPDIISTWKQDVLGGSFNASKFINTIKRYLS